MLICLFRRWYRRHMKALLLSSSLPFDSYIKNKSQVHGVICLTDWPTFYDGKMNIISFTVFVFFKVHSWEVRTEASWESEANSFLHRKSSHFVNLPPLHKPYKLSIALILKEISNQPHLVEDHQRRDWHESLFITMPITEWSTWPSLSQNHGDKTWQSNIGKRGT